MAIKWLPKCDEKHDITINFKQDKLREPHSDMSYSQMLKAKSKEKNLKGVREK